MIANTAEAINAPVAPAKLHENSCSNESCPILAIVSNLNSSLLYFGTLVYGTSKTLNLFLPTPVSSISSKPPLYKL